jgi:hypothetical protein
VAQYRVQSVAPGAFVGQGAVSGALLAALPAAAVGWIAVTVIHAARQTLESWRTVRLPLPAPLPSPSADMTDLLHLTAVLAALRTWDGAPLLVFSALVAAAVALGALAGALAALLAALLFNAGAALGRGFVVELEPVSDTE